MPVEEEILAKLSKSVRKGDIEPVAAYLAATEEVRFADIDIATPSLTVPEKIRLLTDISKALLKDSAEKIGAALADHFSKDYFWLVSSFMAHPDILPAISPDLIEEVIAVLPRSKFPNNKSYLPQHRASSQENGWASRSIPRRLILIAEAVHSLEDSERIDALSAGFRFLPSDIQKATVGEAHTQGKTELVNFFNAAIRSGPLTPKGSAGPKGGSTPPSPLI